VRKPKMEWRSPRKYSEIVTGKIQPMCTP
jgi:hypothetical protein